MYCCDLFDWCWHPASVIFGVAFKTDTGYYFNRHPAFGCDLLDSCWRRASVIVDVLLLWGCDCVGVRVLAV